MSIFLFVKISVIRIAVLLALIWIPYASSMLSSQWNLLMWPISILLSIGFNHLLNPTKSPLERQVYRGNRFLIILFGLFIKPMTLMLDFNFHFIWTILWGTIAVFLFGYLDDLLNRKFPLEEETVLEDKNQKPLLGTLVDITMVLATIMAVVYIDYAFVSTVCVGIILTFYSWFNSSLKTETQSMLPDCTTNNR